MNVYRKLCFNEMKNILILGDSWGVPNHDVPRGAPANTHTEFLLKDLGYNVVNCARSGGSNIDSIERAFPYQVNWIIWFHTELTRDIDLITPTNLNDTIDQLAHLTYQRAADLIKHTNAKIAIIGACATLHPLLFEYITPDFYIKDWVNVICNTNLPPLYATHKVTPKVYKGMTTKNLDYYIKEDKQVLLDLYNDNLKRLIAMKQSGHFPDGGHPGIQPHADLINILKNTLP